ncbi:MAG: hypothetical protein QNJ22_17560 [Desulfosarcinaceae bacterium]|nr:hypothetical protein [Desulfosarcinaceae bacterium]
MKNRLGNDEAAVDYICGKPFTSYKTVSRVKQGITDGEYLPGVATVATDTCQQGPVGKMTLPDG